MNNHKIGNNHNTIYLQSFGKFVRILFKIKKFLGKFFSKIKNKNI